MQFNWAAESYRDIVNDFLGYRKKRRPRGVVKSLSDRLRCHPTFISQVLKERADFSQEQGYEVSHHFSFSPQQREYFLTLLLRDRAGSADLRAYYQRKLEQLLEEKRDLKPRASTDRHPLGSFEAEYFGNWLYQAVHAMTQIRRLQTTAAIAKTLGLPSDEIKSVLQRLELMSLVRKTQKSAWQSTLSSLHLPKESRFIRSLHLTWKTKTLADLQNKSAVSGTRYSGLITVSEKDFQKVRDVLVDTITSIRKIAESSNAEDAYVLALDCYKI